ncbi:hypothetical protein PoB_003129500 [Plakobranchus ocellatus]|uniref:Uncharacterized protein n=1 Tax=Plakobranchus ocellatus TaxID=259542 RepID=A0AAV4ABP6_9GAST|nr:hypothetical protein PoB_003129500 [Plakobranchus ocellatus]
MLSENSSCGSSTKKSNHMDNVLSLLMTKKPLVLTGFYFITVKTRNRITLTHPHTADVHPHPHTCPGFVRKGREAQGLEKILRFEWNFSARTSAVFVLSSRGKKTSYLSVAQTRTCITRGRNRDEE